MNTVSLAIKVAGHWHRLPPMTLEQAWTFAAKSRRLNVYI